MFSCERSTPAGDGEPNDVPTVKTTKIITLDQSVYPDRENYEYHQTRAMRLCFLAPKLFQRMRDLLYVGDGEPGDGSGEIYGRR